MIYISQLKFFVFLYLVEAHFEISSLYRGRTSVKIMATHLPSERASSICNIPGLVSQLPTWVIVDEPNSMWRIADGKQADFIDWVCRLDPVHMEQWFSKNRAKQEWGQVVLE